MRIISRLASVLIVCAVVGCSGKDDKTDEQKGGENAAVKDGAGADESGNDSSANRDKNPMSTDGKVFVGLGSITVTPENTTVTFTGTDGDAKLSGGFKAVEGTIQLGPGPGVETIDLRIETNSLFADDEKLVNELKSKGLFEVDTFPKVSLMSSKIEAAIDGHPTPSMTADLTVREVTKSVTAPFKFEITESGYKLSTEFTISGKEFGFAAKPEVIDDSMTIRIEVDAPPPNRQ